MSVIFNSGTEAALRTTNIVAGSSNYTCCFYLKLSAAGAGYRTAWMTADSIATPTQYVALFTDTATLNLKLWGDNGSGGTFTSTGSTLVADQWARVAYVRSGTSNRFYVNGVLIDTDTLNMSGATLTEVQIGNDGTSDSGIEIAFFREWDSALSIAQLNAEWNARVATTDTALVCDCPLTADLDDISAEGNDFTSVGSLTFDAVNPAVIANGNAQTATVIGPLPDTATQSLNGAGFAFDAFYKWTAEDDGLAGVFGAGNVFASILIRTLVYTGTPTSLTLLIATNSSTVARNRNVPLQFAATAAVDYYFQFSPQNTTVTSATLDVAVEYLTPATAPVGSIVVNNDSNGLPLFIVSGVDGDDYNTLNYIAVAPEGEAGDVLANGTFILNDFGIDTLNIYDDQFVLQQVIASIDISSLVGGIRTCQGTQQWWIAYASGSDRRVRSVAEDGTLGTAHTITPAGFDLGAIAASNDETILYWTGGNALNRAIHQWDLVNDIPLSDLAAEVTGYVTADILVLSDDTIVYSLIDATGTPDVQVRHVDTDGTPLHTYNFGSSFVFPAGTLPRLAYAIDDPDSFWFWTHPVLGTNDGLSRFQEVQVSDGTILTEVDHAEFEGNVYTPDSSDPPLSRFGPPFSCPFFISRVSFAPSTPTTGTLVVTKITIPDSDATAFDFLAPTLTPDAFSLSSGESQVYNDLTPGTFSVEETPNIIYQTTVEVSNGSPNTAITVGAGETVTVTFTNSAVYSPGFNTRPIKRRWLRRGPVYSSQNARVRYKMFALDCEVGTGNNAEPGMDPQCFLQYSDDSGSTWSFIMPMSMGKLGAYNVQLQWWQLGVGRNRVFQIYGSDPVKVALLDGFCRVDPRIG